MEKSASSSPHIIFVLLDDVGWNDIHYNTAESPMVTPVMDNLASQGVQLKQHYMHSLCSPSRAALMTGRYHVNTELTFVIPPASPAGLPVHMTILPEVLRDHGNYSTAMVGKWHLGHSQWKMTPTERGFQEFSGMLAFVPDHFTKEVHQLPWAEPAFIDWMHQKQGEKNATFFAEPRHSTLAVARDAEDIMYRHARGPTSQQPLFLYVAFPAAHAPLTPIPGHEVHCTHIPQSWRRQFCGLVYGIDEALGNITRTALKELGDNVLLVVASDNGGSPWFGGNNMPLRGSKITPLEGGVRAPAFVVDFSHDRHLLHPMAAATNGRVMTDLMHVADWLPTLAAFAGIARDKVPLNIDGVDQSHALQRARPITSAEKKNATLLLQELTFDVRKEMLIEMYYPGEVTFNDTLVAYRIEDMKYIRGIVRDENFYYEPTTAWMSLTHPTWFARVVELTSHILEAIFGDAATDLFRVGITHVRLQDTFTNPQRLSRTSYQPSTIRLFNLTEDPYELHNLLQDDDAGQKGKWKDLVAKFEKRIDHYRVHRPKPQNCNHIVLLDVFRAQAVHNRAFQECATQNPSIGVGHCRFLGPWIPDTVGNVFDYHGQDLVSRQDHDHLLQVKLWQGYLQEQWRVSFSKDTVSQGLTFLPWVWIILVYLVATFVWKKMFNNSYAAKKSKNE